MSGAVLIQTTSDQKEVLSRISHLLIEQKLAACCQISGPVESCYRWNGSVETSQEWQCSIKTIASVAEKIIQLIRQQHNYDVPEIICTEISGGDPEYLRWIVDQVSN